MIMMNTLSNCTVRSLLVTAALMIATPLTYAAQSDRFTSKPIINWSQPTQVQLLRHNIAAGLCKRFASDGGCDYFQHCKDYQTRSEDYKNCDLTGAGRDGNGEVQCEFVCPDL